MFYIPFIWVIIAVLCILWCFQKPRNFPDGPPWWPIIGSALYISRARERTGMLCKGIMEMAQKYNTQNGLIGFKVGKDKIVVAITGPALQEMMQNEVCDGRPTGPFYETRTWNMRRGILLTDEEFWSEQRRFVVRHLKEFGFARRGMTAVIENEAEFLLNDFKEMVRKGNGSALVPMQDAFPVHVLNTLWLLLAGKRYSRNNLELQRMQKLLYDLFASIDMVGAMFSHFPILRFLAPNASGYNQFVQAHIHMHAFFKQEIEEHRKTFKIDSEPRDLIDVYLKAMIESKGEEPSFSEKQLQAVCLDMFIAGSETTTKSMGFGTLHIVRNPKVQAKMQAEIDEVIGKNRRPLLEDRPRMPYCEAVVLEALRFFMGHTFGIPHRALRDTQLCGSFIPKDTMLVGTFRGMLMDENLWKNPFDFNPDRFIEDGKVKIPENFQPFGVGKHRCMGEMMARSNLFLFMTTLFQNFNITVPPGHDLPSDVPLDGATPSVKNYVALVEPRL